MTARQTNSPPLLGTANLSSVVLPIQFSHSAEPAANTLDSPSSAISERTYYGSVGEPSQNPLFGLSPSSITSAPEEMMEKDLHLQIHMVEAAEQQKQSERVSNPSTQEQKIEENGKIRDINSDSTDQRPRAFPDRGDGGGGGGLTSLMTIETAEHPNTPTAKDGKEKEDDEAVANNKETQGSHGTEKPSAHQTATFPSPFLSSPLMSPRTCFELSDGIGPFDDSGTCQDAFVISSRKATENNTLSSRTRRTAEASSAPTTENPITLAHKPHTTSTENNNNNNNNNMSIIPKERGNSPPVQQQPRDAADEGKQKEAGNLPHHIICIYDNAECAIMDGTVNAKADGTNYKNNNNSNNKETIGRSPSQPAAPDFTDEDEDEEEGDEMTATPHDHSFSRTASGTAFDERSSSEVDTDNNSSSSESGSVSTSSSGRGKRALKYNNSTNNNNSTMGSSKVLNNRGSNNSSGWAAVKAIFGVGVFSSPSAPANIDDSEDNEAVQKRRVKARKSSYDIQQQKQTTRSDALRRSVCDQQAEGGEESHQQIKSKNSSKNKRRRPQRPPMRSPSSGANLDEIGGSPATANSRRRSTHFWGRGGAGSSVSGSTTGLFPTPNSRGTCAYDEDKETELKKGKSKLRKEREEMLKRQAESQFVGFGPNAPIIAERNRYTFALLMQDKRDSVGNGGAASTHRHDEHGGTSSREEEDGDGTLSDIPVGKSSLWGAFPRSRAPGGASGLHDPQHSSSSTSFMFATDENGRFVNNRTIAAGGDEPTPAVEGGALPPTVSAASTVIPVAEALGGAGPWLHISVVERPFFIAALLVGGVAYGVFAIASIVATVTNYYNLNGCNHLIKVYQIAAPLFFFLTLLAYWPWCVFFAFWELPKRLAKGRAISKIATLLSSVCCLGLMGSCAVALVGIIASGGQDKAEESTCGLPYQFTRTVSIAYLVFTFIAIVAYMSYYSLLVSRTASRTSGKVTKEGNPIFSSVTPLPKPKARASFLDAQRK